MKPTPFQALQTKDDLWSVMRLTFKDGATPDDPVTTCRDIAGEKLSLRAAVALSMQLNESQWEFNPVDVAEHFFLWASERGTGGARVMAGVLLGLYNGRRFPFDLTELSNLDARHKRMALCLIDSDSPRVLEVHSLLDEALGRNDFGMRFERLAWIWKRDEDYKEDPFPGLPGVALKEIAKPNEIAE